MSHQTVTESSQELEEVIPFKATDTLHTKLSNHAHKQGDVIIHASCCLPLIVTLLSDSSSNKQVSSEVPDNSSEQGGAGLIVEGDDDTGGREVFTVCLRSTPGRRAERETSLSGSTLASCPARSQGLDTRSGF